VKKVLISPEVVAAIIAVIGSLMVGIILGVAEGKIGFGSLLAVVAFIVLILLLFLLYKRSGPKVTAGAALVMLVIGFAVFMIFFRKPGGAAKPTPTLTPTAAPTAPAPTAITATKVVQAPAQSPAVVPTSPPPTAPVITPPPLPTPAPGQIVAVPDAQTGLLIPPGPQPVAIAVGGDSIWVADDTEHRIYQMDRTGATLSSFAIGNRDWVSGMAWDGQALLVVMGDWGSPNLVRLDTQGNVLSSVPFPVNATGLGWNAADSTIWTAVWEQGHSFLVQFAKDGKLLQILVADVFGMPDGLTCATDGIWVTDTFGDVDRFSFSGDRLRHANLNIGDLPQISPAVHADGTLYLISKRNRKIYQFSTRPEGAAPMPTPYPEERGARYFPQPTIEPTTAGGLPTVRITNGFSGPLTVSVDRDDYPTHEAGIVQPGQTWTVQAEAGAYTIFASTSGQGMVTLWAKELLVKGYAFTWVASPPQ